MEARFIHAWITGLCCLLPGCHRTPQTAAELQKNIPHRFQGEIHLQGEQKGRTIIVEPHDFTVLDEHTLEFNRVRYQFGMGTEVGGAGDAQIRGTISAPGLIVRVESVSGGSEVDTDEILKAGTFQGKLSGNLQKLEATWKTEFGAELSLRTQAEP